MITILIKRNHDGQVLTFNGSGHSEADDFGSDIVCAGISAVMQTTLLGLGEYLGLEDRLTYNIDDDGWLYCALPQDLTAVERVRADAIIETMILGIKAIQSEYAEFISVEEEVE